jgi:hypothetical protein
VPLTLDSISGGSHSAVGNAFKYFGVAVVAGISPPDADPNVRVHRLLARATPQPR